jgi:hypothetical protein
VTKSNLIHPSWVYGISFLPRTSRRKYPEIVFTAAARHVPFIEDWFDHEEKLARLADIPAYLGKSVPFFLPGGREGSQLAFPLSGKDEFGFAGCGYIVRDAGKVHYHLPIQQAHVHHLTLTIHMLSMVLNHLLSDARSEGAPTSSHKQIAEIGCHIRTDIDIHGHPLGGDIFLPMRRWLERHGGDKALCEKAEAAMRAVWRSLARDEGKRHASECRCRLERDGRFGLQCLGDACDVSMYPDGAPGHPEYPYRFSCHNLDHASQQLTLLAGLAVLCDSAAKDIDPQGRHD